MKTFTLYEGQKPTKEQLEEVREAAKREIQFDEDAPELSPSMYQAFKRSLKHKRGMERRRGF